jgi:hypothetical protein
LYVVGELRNEIIKPPSAAIPTKILGSSRWNPYLKVIVICTSRTIGLYCSNHIGLYLLITLAIVCRTVLEPLGVNLADSQAAKIEGSYFNIASDQKSPTERGESSKAISQQPQSAVGGKGRGGTSLRMRWCC